MSATTRKSSWVKQNYANLLLVVILLLLLLSAVFLVLQVMNKTAEQAAVLPTVSFAKATLVNAADVEKKLDVLERTNLMDVARGVMGDELRVSCVNPKCAKPIPYQAALCPFCAAKQPEPPNIETENKSGDGIADAWKRKYGLDVEANVAKLDPDGDGFNNLEEFLAGTNPLDPKSHPDVASKLRLWAVKQRAFKLRYMASMALSSNVTFQINLRSGRTVFVKLGDVAEGYKVISHDPKATEGDVLVLEKGPEQLRLVKGKDLQQFEVTADLILMFDHKRYNNMAKDTTVKIRDTLYNIIDITTNAVTMRGPPPGNDIVVKLISEDERAEVMSAAAAAPVPEPVPATVLARPVAPAPVVRETRAERPAAPPPVIVPRRGRGN